jgi:FkbM family methyltransferase
MSLFNLLRFILNHPVNRRRRVGALLDFTLWQIRSRLARGPIVYRWINGARVNVRHGETGFTMNIYCGLHDFVEMAYLLHVLRQDDLFADVGANMGSYTLLAAAVRGTRTASFEPVPGTFARLSQNILLNGLGSRVTARSVGVGEKPGHLRLSVGEDCCNHVLGANEEEESLEVKVVTLNETLAGDCPALLKIDVEGFELPVLRGATALLQNPALHSIIVEYPGAGSRYGYDESDLVALLTKHGFVPCGYDPFTRTLTALAEPTQGNALFIRGLEQARARVRDSEAFRVKNLTL